MERVYTVPLTEAYEHTRSRRARRSIKELRKFLVRHLKMHTNQIKLSRKVNALLWSGGMKKPPRKIKIKVVKEEKVVNVYLLDEKIELKEKKEEKKPEEAKVVAEAKKIETKVKKDLANK